MAVSRICWCFLTIAGLFCLVVEYVYAQEQKRPNTSLGRDIYEEQCASCHLEPELKAPSLEAMGFLSAERIHFSLTEGSMTEQGALLSTEEQDSVVSYLTRGNETGDESGAFSQCIGQLSDTSAITWSGWADDPTNRRFKTAEESGLSLSNISRLTLQWAYAFPNTIRMRAQPAISKETIYLGGQTGEVSALSLETGCRWWTFTAQAEVRGAISLIDLGDVNERALVFSDFAANVYRLDAKSGALIWKANLAEHAKATITGALTVFENRVLVPLSSTEILNAVNPTYECCTFRGGLAALDLMSGELLWRSYAVDKPVQQQPNSTGTIQWGPSGAPVWGSPTVDVERRQVYFGTGQNYSSPATPTSDAVLAVNLDTGERIWVFQTLEGDAWNAACVNSGANCPIENGPDFDVGAAPVLVETAEGMQFVIAGNKGGMVFALDPDNGGLIWKKKVGRGGRKGGVHWGLSSDDARVYVGVGDLPDELDSDFGARPGLHALDVTTGDVVWSVITDPTCIAKSFRCYPSFSGALTVTSGLVMAGGMDGKLHAFSTDDGTELWRFDTDRKFETVNGILGSGGSIDADGPVIADGRLVINSGYDLYGQLAGNVLLIFAVGEH